MIVYHCRSGIILTKICDEYLLVATKTARYECPYVKQVNETAAVIWKELSEEVSIDQLMEKLSETYEFPDKEAAEKAVCEYLDDLISNHYLCTETR